MPLRSPDEAVWLVVQPKPSVTSLPSRFPTTLRAVPPSHRHVLPLPEAPIHPSGTTGVAILYALGHEGTRLTASQTLNPASIRQLRHAAYLARKQKQRLHLFGLLDNDSPYGSRRLVEAVVRHLKLAQVPIVLHLGVWQPTPTEFERGLAEMRTLCDASTRIGSLFPVSFLDRHGTNTYVAALANPEPQEGPVTLPLHQPCVWMDDAIHPEDGLMVLNHRLHGLDPLVDGLAEAGLSRPQALASDHPMPQWLDEALAHNQHIMAISNRAAFIEAFTGTAVTHPYFETFETESAQATLEMLISPHFGYTKRPHRTIVLLDETAGPNFDWLLAAFLRQNIAKPYYCCLLNPSHLEGSILLTNHSTFEAASNPYHTLHRQPAWVDA